jgi:hypothetical protein
MLQVVGELEEALHKVDQLINLCYTDGLDYRFLVTAKEAMTNQMVIIKESVAYKMAEYEDYGTPLDDDDVEGVKVLIEEIGYDNVRALFGEAVDTVLAEAVKGE